mmetsp:Transcript_126291/g.289065  ORF Transcript_126291/g.289065 Transcript_126291/m.289065 type:complete len:215 (+) Transcript_126291:3-647(+)
MSVRMAQEQVDGLLDPAVCRVIQRRTGLAVCEPTQTRTLALAGTPKQLNLAQSLLKSLANHCQYGFTAHRAMELLTKREVESVTVRLSPMCRSLKVVEQRLAVGAEKLRFGKDSTQCQVLVDLEGISRKHAVIIFEGRESGHCYLKDLSTNGTYLNRRKLEHLDKGKRKKKGKEERRHATTRIVHGDELTFRSFKHDGEDEELGYIVNLHYSVG